jgi:hypothetical protein
MPSLPTNLFLAGMLVTAVVGYDIAHTDTVKAAEPATATVSATLKTPTPTAVPVVMSTEAEEVEKEIRLVFGEHTDKALKLLKGNGPNSCAENRTLNPKVKNYNCTYKNEKGETYHQSCWPGDEGKATSVDYGTFQINDYWQGFRHTGKAEQFLYDYKINIRVAWRVYEDSGYSFNKWSCGKVYGI